MRILVNGLDLYLYSAPNGVTIQSNVMDSPESGRNMDGTMQRSIVGVKEKITVKFPAISQATAQKLLGAVSTPFVKVSYTSPRLGERSNVSFYAQPSAMTPTPPRQLPGDRGISAWSGLELTLVER